ncbi:hypothetical protein DsansV1_C25g0189791 [Dioscorea sansibarensis]
MLTLFFSPNSVQNLEIIEPLHIELWGSRYKMRSLFYMLKTAKTIGGCSRMQNVFSFATSIGLSVKIQSMRK